MAIIDLIETDILEPERYNDSVMPEAIAFFWKVKGDFYRYICEGYEFGDRLTECKDEAKKCYNKANEISLHACSATKISIGLNMSIFEAEVNKSI